MSNIERTITVTRKGMQHQIQVVEGTSLLPISVIVSDYDILSGSAAVAYNRQPNGTLVNQACTISENTISFTPPEGFYLKGYNKTQVRVTNNNRNLFSFVIDVWCDENITDDADVEEINSQPTLVTQLLSQIGVLTARMDAFTALPEGSTTSDAALNDIRIGYDGTEYPTPGDAVRGQVSSLSEENSNIVKYSNFNSEYELFEDYETYPGTYLQNGEEHTTSGFQCVCTSFIPVIPGEHIGANYNSYLENNMYGCNFYDSKKKFISGYDNPEYTFSKIKVDDITIPEKCYFVRIQRIFSQDGTSFKVYKSSAKVNGTFTISLLISLIKKTYSVNNGAYIPCEEIKVIDDQYINGDGAIYPATSWKYTDFIDVYDIPYLYITHDAALYNNPNLVLYDKYYNFLTGINVSNNRKRYTIDEIFSINEKTRYVRLSAYKSLTLEKRDDDFLNDQLDKIFESISELQDAISNTTNEKIKSFEEITDSLNVSDLYLGMQGEERPIKSCHTTGYIDLASYKKVWFTGGWKQADAAAYIFYDECT